MALSGGDALRRPERVPRTAIPCTYREEVRKVGGGARVGATDAVDLKTS
jgi:hypothetical protein